MGALDSLIGGGVFDVLGKAIDRIWPDKEKADQIKLEMFKLEREGALEELKVNLELAQSQNQVNQAEASNGNLFVSGWRPFIGWICGVGLLYQFLIIPVLTVILQAEQITNVIPPHLDDNTLMTLLFGMLGLGAFRTTEKIAVGKR